MLANVDAGQPDPLRFFDELVRGQGGVSGAAHGVHVHIDYGARHPVSHHSGATEAKFNPCVNVIAFILAWRGSGAPLQAAPCPYRDDSPLTPQPPSLPRLPACSPGGRSRPQLPAALPPLARSPLMRRRRTG